jgi:signal transduction histidine kinase
MKTGFSLSSTSSRLLIPSVLCLAAFGFNNTLLAGGLLFLGVGLWSLSLQNARNTCRLRKAYADALINAQEEERKSIARDLHDGIGQSLLLLKKKLERSTGFTTEHHQMIADALNEVRALSRDLYPMQLENLGLTSAIESMAQKIEDSTDLIITCEMDRIDHLLEPKAEMHVFRTVQEALNNIIKHAHASAAKICIKVVADKIQIDIMDNGVGICADVTLRTTHSMGMRTMAERVAAMGGKLNFETGPVNGLQVRISIPKKCSKKEGLDIPFKYRLRQISPSR